MLPEAPKRSSVNLLESDGSVPQAHLRNRHNSLCCSSTRPHYRNKQKKKKSWARHGDEISAVCVPYFRVSRPFLNTFTNQNEKSDMCLWLVLYYVMDWCCYGLSELCTLFLLPVFSSLDMSRSVSVTAVGQCRLAPLIQVILDCSHLYDYTVRLLFKLHSCKWLV